MRLRITAMVLALLALPAVVGAQKKQLTLEDIILSDKFDGDFLNQPRWHADSQYFTFLMTDTTDGVTSVWRHDAETGEETIMLDGHELTRPGSEDPISLDEYCLSDDGSKILIHTDTVSVWRWSQLGRCFVYNLTTEAVQPVYEGEETITNVKFSPDGNMVGFVLNNDIYVKDLTSGNTCRWTHDGSEVIINGKFDWAYEEEFGCVNGWEWSPDSKKIAFWRLDQSGVPEFSWIDYNPLHQEIITIRYPKAGDPVAVPQIGVINIEADTTVWIDIGEETDVYIPRIKWTNSSDTLSIMWLNRAQNHLELLLVDVNNGQTDIVLTETDSCYVDVHDNLIFLEGKDQLVWTSEIDGYNHIYIYTTNGQLVQQVTIGEWDVIEVYGVDEENETVYFRANKDGYTEWHIYAASMDGREVKKISAEPGWHKAYFSKDCRYFIDEYSNARTPLKTALKRADGTTARMLRENEMPVLDEYELSFLETFTFTAEDGAILDAFMIRPADFDESKKYPVLVYCYGGPYGQQVMNEWGKDSGTRWLLQQNYLAQHGYIVFCVDNRGVGCRGKADRNLVFGDLAKWPVHDHIRAAKYLTSLPYVDRDRIGIYGWSFGGYVTLHAMCRAPEYFKVGVAGAPVTNYELYDAIYTERFMMEPGENPEGYKTSSVFTYIDGLEGKLLIVHGAKDDNVHFQNTMQLAEVLQKAGKKFEMMIYPSQPHGFSGKQIKLHQTRTMFDFIIDNL
ncbi:MAG: S9 family peptidase [Candidatus Zixiibacteriota bacterium]|nr:MAG: S9 family peptidase [candidate division Zixibacteria bacterium]